MLIAAFICVFSVAALVRFAVYSWRATLLRLAPEPLAASEANLLQSRDFQDIVAYQNLCPELSRYSGPKLRGVGLYYRAVQALNTVAEFIVPKGMVTNWAQGEMAVCGRYAMAVLSQRVARNEALGIAARSV